MALVSLQECKTYSSDTAKTTLSYQPPIGIASLEETHLVQGHTSFQGKPASNDIRSIKAWPPCVNLGQLQRAIPAPGSTIVLEPAGPLLGLHCSSPSSFDPSYLLPPGLHHNSTSWSLYTNLFFRTGFLGNWPMREVAGSFIPEVSSITLIMVREQGGHGINRHMLERSEENTWRYRGRIGPTENSMK